MPIILSPRVSSPTLWTSRRELEILFGRTQVARWADIENTQDAELVEDAIHAACIDATDDAMSRLSSSACGVIVTAPPMLRRQTTRLAAGFLYEARGVQDTSDEDGKHRLKYSLDRADKWFKFVKAGLIELTGVPQPTNVPFVSQHLVRVDGQLRTPEEILYNNERREKQGVPTYAWFWGDGFSTSDNVNVLP